MTLPKLRPTFTFDQERLDALKAIAPEAFADGKIQWEALRAALGDHLEEEGDGDGPAEHFGLFWPGKRAARRLASTPSAGTLRPAPGEGVNEATTRHIFIEGDNLEVLKLLQKSYAGRVKMIYIDPPYNTGNDFIYSDNFTQPLEEYLRATEQADEMGRMLVTNRQAGGRYHSNWLNMMYPRLRLARNLLRDDGVIFVSIDDHEVHNLRVLMGEVFGEENFVAELIWEGALKNDSRFVSISHDYMLCFGASKEELTTQAIVWRNRKEGIDDIYAKVEALRRQFGDQYNLISEELRNWYRMLPKTHPAWQHRHYSKVDRVGVYFPSDISWPGGGGPTYPVIHPVTKKPVAIPARGWVYPSPQRMQQAINEDRVDFGPTEKKVPTLKRYLRETEGQVLPSVIYKDRRAAMQRLRQLLGEDVFENPKDETVIGDLVEATTGKNDIVLDFFAGSCTTAHGVLNLNREDIEGRRFVMVQLPESTGSDSQAQQAGYATIADIGKERIRRVIKRMQAEEAGKLPLERETPEDLGFRVFKLDRSHYRAWKDFEGGDVAELQTLFDQFESPLVEGWKPEDVLVEVMLMEGFPLDSTTATLPEFAHNTVTRVASDLVAHRLFVCLDAAVHDETIAALALGEEDIFICLDAALTDEAKVRLEDGKRVKVI